MVDSELVENVRQMLELEPIEGLWKLTDSEMQALSDYFASWLDKAYNTGWDQSESSMLKIVEKLSTEKIV